MIRTAQPAVARIKPSGLGLLAAMAATFGAPVAATLAQEEISRGPMLVEIAIRTAPALAIAGGRRFLVYELHLTNFVPDRTMTIDGVEVVGPGGTALLSLDKAAVARNLRVVGPAVAEEPTQLTGGQRALLFIWAPVGGGRSLTFRHRVRLHIAGVPRTYLIDDLARTVALREPIVLSPPVRGGPWVAANGPEPAHVPAHNQLLFPEHGVIHLPQRYATDWVSLGPDGRTFSGPIDQNGSYAAYGVPVLAVANGRVAVVHDGVRDNRPPEVTEKLGQPDRAGNHVILDLGRGAFAFYGHLKPGSIAVKVGDRVVAGQRLAAVGNTGNSTGPHLHFHVTDGASLGSEGVPFVFDTYDDLGPLTATLDEMEAGKPTAVGGSARKRNDLPLGGRIVRFAPAQRR